VTPEEHTDLGVRIRELKDAVRTEAGIETLALEVDGLYRYAARHQEIAANTAISVYPVGILLHARQLWHRGLAGQPLNIRWHVQMFCQMWRNRNYWNGFLAEVDYPPAGLTHTVCGRGWTRRRAARDLGYKLWLDNKKES
jgi:hypothetical protein